MVRGKTHQKYATYFICSYPTFKHNSGVCEFGLIELNNMTCCLSSSNRGNQCRTALSKDSIAVIAKRCSHVPVQTLNEVRERTDKWIKEYNEERPHDALGDMTSREFLLTQNRNVSATGGPKPRHLHKLGCMTVGL
jgi:hypothetical protein